MAITVNTNKTKIMIFQGSNHSYSFFFSIDASYQVSVHLAKQFQRTFLKIGRSETIITYGSHACKRIGKN